MTVSATGDTGVRVTKHRPSILIVDDDSWTTRALAAALADTEEIEVLEPVHSGEAGVRAYAREHPDIVLMDINMPPGMSGVDATAAIIDIDPGAAIVLLTTVAPGPGIARALDAGARAAVTKTATATVLLDTIRSVLADESPAALRRLAEDIVISGDLLPDAPAAPPHLTDCERILLENICEGVDYGEIARRQGVTVHTVKSHAQNLRVKLGAKNLAQVVLRAIQFKFHLPERGSSLTVPNRSSERARKRYRRRSSVVPADLPEL